MYYEKNACKVYFYNLTDTSYVSETVCDHTILKNSLPLENSRNEWTFNVYQWLYYGGVNACIKLKEFDSHWLDKSVTLKAIGLLDGCQVT